MRLPVRLCRASASCTWYSVTNPSSTSSSPKGFVRAVNGRQLSRAGRSDLLLLARLQRLLFVDALDHTLHRPQGAREGVLSELFALDEGNDDGAFRRGVSARGQVLALLLVDHRRGT